MIIIYIVRSKRQGIMVIICDTSHTPIVGGYCNFFVLAISFWNYNGAKVVYLFIFFHVALSLFKCGEDINHCSL